MTADYMRNLKHRQAASYIQLCKLWIYLLYIVPYILIYERLAVP